MRAATAVLNGDLIPCREIRTGNQTSRRRNRRPIAVSRLPAGDSGIFKKN
jgi:hypothetical protein